MAIDEPTKRKRGTPAGDPHSVKSKMGQKMVHRKRALLDEGRRHEDGGGGGDDDFEPAAMGGTPAGDSPHSTRTKMGQKMSLAHRRLSLLDNGSSISRHIAAAAAAAADDDGGGSEQMDEEFAVDVPQKNTAVVDSDDDFVPLIMMRTKIVKSEPGKHPGFRYKHKAQRTITKTCKRKKTGRPPGSKRYSKRKIVKKPMLVENSNISKSNKDKDADFEPERPDDDGRKKYASALDRALEVENKLPAEGPSFVKLMRKSHVVKGFWLGVPLSFCRNHLPNDDVTIALEDEDGHSYDTNYLARKQGLSGGWHGFVVRHGLKVGDAAIFQLVGPKRFKVYILRENKFTTTDGALGLLSLDTSMENNMPDDGEKGEDTCDEDFKSKEDPEVTKVITNKASDDDSCNDLFSEAAVNGGIRSADPDPDFNAMAKTFRAFKMAIDSSVIDRKLVPDHQLWTYYKLCGAKKAFLHGRLPENINPTLAAGVLAETAGIAKGIRSYDPTSSSCKDLAAWKKTLESFELLGMDVGFMRKRVDELLFLLDARSPADHAPEGYNEEMMKLEHGRATEKVRALESKLASLKDALREMDMEMQEIAGERRGHAVLHLAAAPW